MIEVFATPENIEVVRTFFDKLKDVEIPTALRKLMVNFEPHLLESYEKNNRVKLLCSKTIPTNLQDIYVSTFFQCKDDGKNTVDENFLVSDIRENKRVIVRGNGGSGKTFFMKKMWNDIFDAPFGRVPVFIELRKLNSLENSGDGDLKSFVKHTISPKKVIEDDVFDSLAKDGVFIFLFDGFDELALDVRKSVESKLLSLEAEYKKCGFVISGRPSENYFGWSEFYIYDVLPFDEEQVRSLISKTPTPSSLRKSFLNTMKEDNLFEKHKEFFSSPLLALMMLITYRDQANIPENLHEFYEDAFIALYREHDASKDTFKREHFLSITDFRRVFATFSMFSYQQSQVSFKETELIGFLEKSIRFIQQNYESFPSISVDELKHEIVESVNLIQLDGREYIYVHRSFQEYFAAFFTINLGGTNSHKFLRLLAEKYYDRALSIAFALDRNLVEREFVLKKIAEVEHVIGSLNAVKQMSPLQILCLMGLEISISGDFDANHDEFFMDTVGIFDIYGIRIFSNVLASLYRIKSKSRTDIYQNFWETSSTFLEYVLEKFPSIADDPAYGRARIEVNYTSENIHISNGSHEIKVQLTKVENFFEFPEIAKSYVEIIEAIVSLKNSVIDSSNKRTSSIEEYFFNIDE